MDPERWQRLKEIYKDALEKNGADRDEFLEKACGSDSDLRREAAALLRSCGGDSFLEKPVYETDPELFEIEAALEGRRLGPYAVIRRIGRGGTGIVYLAMDTRLDRHVAVKMLAPGYTSEPQQRERLKREAKAAAKLSHPGIATVYSLEEFDDNLYMVSEYVQGETLFRTVSGGSLAKPVLLDMAVQIARALRAAHEQGIVHRDLKPENVMRTETGIIKILDFGLARFSAQEDVKSAGSLTRSGIFLGTPIYASPEQLLGSRVDFHTDVFSFGVLLYELATGRHPFGTADSMSTIARILEADPPPLAGMDPSIPDDLDRIVRRCMKKRPSDRYESTQELLSDLERLSGAYTDSAKSSSDRHRKKALSPLWWWQFHQACAGFGYYGMLYPLWRVKQWLGGVEGSLFFFPALVAVGVAANLRLHLWFTSRFYSSELSHQRRRVSFWIRCADWLFVIMLAASAIRIHTIHAIIATLLMSVSIGSLVAFSLIEPTTTKAALDKEASDTADVQPIT